MVTKKDLWQAPEGSVLFCPVCLAQYSADPSDYFMLHDDDLVGPCACGEELVLVRIERKYQIITT